MLEVNHQGKAARINTYVNVIASANFQAVKEAINMSDTVRSLDDVLEVTGVAARVEARAKERGALAIAQNLINLGLPMETVISATMLDPEKVKALYGKK